MQRGPDEEQVGAVRDRRRGRHLRGGRELLRRDQVRRRPGHRRGEVLQPAAGQPGLLQEDVDEPHAEAEVGHTAAQQARPVEGTHALVHIFLLSPPSPFFRSQSEVDPN